MEEQPTTLKVPFSQSSIWQSLRDVYVEQGLDIWLKKSVSYNLTNSPYLAQEYAQSIAQILRQYPKKVAEPLYIIELGAGMGRLAHRILFELQSIVKQSVQDYANYCYVMTDIADSMLLFWQNNPSLKPYFANGTLDCALFDGTQATEIKLQIRQGTLKPHQDERAYPIIFIANYFYGILPVDIVQFRDDGLGIATFDYLTDELDEFPFKFEPIELPYYHHAFLDQLLKTYQTQIKSSDFVIPVAAIQLLDYFYSLSPQGFIIFTADHGFHSIEQFKDYENMFIVESRQENAFGVAVNFHAIEQFIFSIGGTSLIYSDSNTALNILAFIYDAQQQLNLAALKQQADNFNIHALGFQTELDLVSVLGQLDLKANKLAHFLELEIYDLEDFAYPQVREKILKIAKNSIGDECQTLCRALIYVAERYYYLFSDLDLPSFFAEVCVELQCYEQALAFQERSIQLFGASPKRSERLLIYQGYVG